MLAIEKYRNENKEIKDLCEVIFLVIEDYSLMKNSVANELLDRFFDKVKKHLKSEDRAIYGDLLSKHSPDANKMAGFFLENTRELKKVNKQFVKQWSATTHSEEQHQQFIKDIKGIFKLACDRIEFEEKKIFPLISEQ
ncbi:MAG: hemerythrin domain-containing protein [bacterium]